MSDWRSTLKHMRETGDTIAVEHQAGGGCVFFLSKTNQTVNVRTVNKLLERKVIRAAGLQIDPTYPQAFEAVEADHG